METRGRAALCESCCGSKPTRSFLSDCQGAGILRGIWYVGEPGMVLDTQLNTQRDGMEVWKMAAADCGVFPVHLSSAWWDMIHDFTSIWKTRQATFTRCHQQEVSTDKSQCCSFKHGARSTTFYCYNMIIIGINWLRFPQWRNNTSPLVSCGRLCSRWLF